MEEMLRSASHFSEPCSAGVRNRTGKIASRSSHKEKRLIKGLIGALIILCALVVCLAVISLKPVILPHLPENIASYETEPATEEVWTVTEASPDNLLPESDNPVIREANRRAEMYDYEGAANLIRQIEGYESDEVCVRALKAYDELASQTVVWTDYGSITHVFFHILVVDEELAFASEKRDDYNKVMTTVDEFKKIIQSMYDRGYVLISLHKIARMEQQPDGTMKMVKQEIRLPRGKKPFVLSEDDVCYYEYMKGHGFATKLCLDANGKVVNEYVERDGSVSYGSYDVLTILEDFIAEHPDFSYQGSKGILAFTGYDGVLGYRTSDFWYTENCPYYISNEKNDREKREDHTSPNLNIEQDKVTARAVADAIKALGWEMASHSWGHLNMKGETYERVAWDTDMWEREVQPIIGDTDIILYPLGADVGEWMPTEYSAANAKYMKLKEAGFTYFCNVDGAQYWLQYGDEYMRQARRNLDGMMIYKQIVYPDRMLVTDLFDAEEVFDDSRPVPVPGVVLPTEAQTQESTQENGE